MKQEPGRQQPGISGLQAGEDVNSLCARLYGKRAAEHRAQRMLEAMECEP